MSRSFRQRSYQDVRDTLLARREIALLDVREEDPHAQAHPLFAANFPFSKIELDAARRLPRLSVPIVVFDAGEGLAVRSAQRLSDLGYTDVALLDGGLDGWRNAGGEVFRDVNVPSKAFGEYVEAHRHTPSLSADEVDALLQSDDDVVVLDARRFDEYQTMNIPGSVSVPGAELALRARALAPDATTRVIVNCAGRTRSIIGTQSLVNAGLPNPVAALRNGTIGWTLAGKTLEQGSARRPVASVGLDPVTLSASHQAARAVADRAGVRRATAEDLARWETDDTRTLYRFDVRTPEECEAGRLPAFVTAPGGQLVQETEMFAPTRGARIVLFDTDGVRANMTASWLAQMNNETYVLDGVSVADLNERRLSPNTASIAGIAGNAGNANDAATSTGSARPGVPPASPSISAEALAVRLQQTDHETLVLDFTTSANYVKRHIPGAWWALRSRLHDDLRTLPDAKRYVVTCGTSALARFVAPEVAALTGKPVEVLEGGTRAWIDKGFPLESGETHLASPRIDRYRRPYEGTDAPHEAMHAYLEWEFGLVAQLGRDGTHGFFVI